MLEIKYKMINVLFILRVHITMCIQWIISEVSVPVSQYALLCLFPSWEMIDSRHGGESEPASQITDSWTSFKLFLEETSSFKQQNPGKVCTWFTILRLWCRRVFFNKWSHIMLTINMYFSLSQFCLLVCSFCSFLAVLGRYIPGIVLSYMLGKQCSNLKLAKKL